MMQYIASSRLDADLVKFWRTSPEAGIRGSQSFEDIVVKDGLRGVSEDIRASSSAWLRLGASVMASETTNLRKAVFNSRRAVYWWRTTL